MILKALKSAYESVKKTLKSAYERVKLAWQQASFWEKVGMAILGSLTAGIVLAGVVGCIIVAGMATPYTAALLSLVVMTTALAATLPGALFLINVNYHYGLYELDKNQRPVSQQPQQPPEAPASRLTGSTAKMGFETEHSAQQDQQSSQNFVSKLWDRITHCHNSTIRSNHVNKRAP